MHSSNVYPVCPTSLMSTACHLPGSAPYCPGAGARAAQYTTYLSTLAGLASAPVLRDAAAPASGATSPPLPASSPPPCTGPALRAGSPAPAARAAAARGLRCAGRASPRLAPPRARPAPAPAACRAGRGHSRMGLWTAAPPTPRLDARCGCLRVERPRGAPLSSAGRVMAAQADWLLR